MRLILSNYLHLQKEKIQMQQTRNNNEPFFSLHNFGLLWVFIMIIVLSIGIQYWAEQDHNRREKQKQEQVEHEKEK